MRDDAYGQQSDFGDLTPIRMYDLSSGDSSHTSYIRWPELFPPPHRVVESATTDLDLTTDADATLCNLCFMFRIGMYPDVYKRVDRFWDQRQNDDPPTPCTANIAPVLGHIQVSPNEYAIGSIAAKISCDPVRVSRYTRPDL